MRELKSTGDLRAANDRLAKKHDSMHLLRLAASLDVLKRAARRLRGFPNNPAGKRWAERRLVEAALAYAEDEEVAERVAAASEGRIRTA